MGYLKKWVYPILDLKKFWFGIRSYVQYLHDWHAYSSMAHAETLSTHDAFPCLYDRTAITSYDLHYFYQGIWAFKLIQASGVPNHVDVGSLVSFVGMLTANIRVIFIDIRPLEVNLENFASIAGSVLFLPFSDNSVASLSCLHVAEHIGLGRYSDPLDPEGTIKATRELARVLAPGGNLYFSVPVGRPRVCFNAHRVHSIEQIIYYFSDLELVQFSLVDDSGKYRPNVEPNDLIEPKYACGLFQFTKRLGTTPRLL